MKYAKNLITAIAAALLVFSLTACNETGSNAQTEGQKVTEQAFEQQSKAVPYPADELRDSLERRNLVERLRRTNDPDKIGYVYLINYGDVMGYYTIKGKVSSTQSQMTTDQLVVKGDFGEGWESQVVNAPGDDGSYGANEEGIFFFTTEGAFVTTSLDYVYADAPLPFNVPELS